MRVTVSYDTRLPDLQKITEYPVQALQRDNRPPEFLTKEIRQPLDTIPVIKVSEPWILRQIPENSPKGARVAPAVTATDPDGDTLKYSVVLPGPPSHILGAPSYASHFTIDESTGEIIFDGGVIIDFENKEGPRRIDITVGVTDGKNVDGEDDDSIDATIDVFIEASDVDEEGPGLGPATTTTPNGAPQMSPGQSAPGKAAPAPLKRPLGMRAQPGNGSATLSWKDPGNSSIIGYEYAWYSDNAVNISAWEPVPNGDADTTEFTITGLENDLTYIVFIRAVDENGPGKVSAVAVTPNEAAQAALRPARIFICMEEMIGRRLYKDCSILLNVKDELDRDGILNWSVFVPITQWDGITVKGTPKRVKRIDLPNRGLVGSIPEDLAGLNKLTHLNLKGNNLADTCTPKAVADGLKVVKPAACADD